MIVWPFKPLIDMRESQEWRTDIIRPKATEQRIALRTEPRTVYSMRHVFTAEQYQAARAIVRRDEGYLVPDWTQAIKVGDVQGGSGALVNYPDDYHFFTDGDAVLVWQSDTQYEQGTVQDVDSLSNTVYINGLTGTYSSAYLLPLYTATAVEGLQAQRPAGPALSTSITFELTQGSNVGASSYTQYRGADWITDCAVVGGGVFNEPLSYPVDTVDGGVAYPTRINSRDLPDVISQMRWHVFTRAERHTLRRFIHTRRGRWRAFWLSSQGRDLTLTTAVGAADTTMTVYAPRNQTNLGVTAFDLDIDGVGTRVSSYSTGTPIGDRQTLTLNITALGVAKETSARVSFLRLMRFDADRVEYLHGKGMAVSVPVIEVPA